ncbi:neuropeptide FF receptor 1 [Python bivittatus]|uniref:Neuropeptide FF receptor 1 n=1 Tax=Python bivittatus TaxID=176946 RepID=A0A9F2NGR3_PYTBI|nr:neuropeptide FF receptor 1 [Python bivittatus]
MENEEGIIIRPTKNSPPFSKNTSHGETYKGNFTFSPYYQHSSPVASMFIVAYAFIFFMCMIGNMLVCFIVLKNRQMRTVTNFFILNLAISDVLVGIFCMPTTLVDNLITGWPFDIFMCKMSGLVQGMSVSASVFTLVAIAVERFRCIVYPFRQKLTLQIALIIIVIIWVLALIIMCPSAVTLTVTRDENHFMLDAYNNSYPFYSCWEAWPDQKMRKIYTTVLFSHIYLAPLVAIVIMYAQIAFKLFKSSAPIRASQSEDSEGRRISKRKIKVINMLIIVALFFTLSWLPLWTLMLLTDYGNLTDQQLNHLTVYFFPFAHWLAFFNSSVNPIIYGYFNENFRRGFQAAFKIQFCLAEKDHQDAYSDHNNSRSLFRAHNRIFVEVQGTDSVRPSDSRESNLLKAGLFLTKNRQVVHHGLMVEEFDNKSCSPKTVSIPAWDI